MEDEYQRWYRQEKEEKQRVRRNILAVHETMKQQDVAWHEQEFGKEKLEKLTPFQIRSHHLEKFYTFYIDRSWLLWPDRQDFTDDEKRKITAAAMARDTIKAVRNDESQWYKRDVLGTTKKEKTVLY